MQKLFPYILVPMLRKEMRARIPKAALGLGLVVGLVAQAAPLRAEAHSPQADSVIDSIPDSIPDTIFEAYTRPGSPGCSLGVIRDGSFLYRHAYGEASLELGVAISPESVFYVGSISKQFTAASVVLAAEQGYLGLDDDVRKYIPELPTYSRTITLRQMLNQTSGFRDMFDLIYLSGHNPAAFNSPGEVLKLIERQRGLNNVPGGEWVYSNTNYFLLGVVLSRATRETLAQFAEHNIFRPLGMTHTLFYDDASVVVPGRVAAYDPGADGRFLVDWSTTYAIVGGGGLMTTLDDLRKWDENFYSNRLGRGTLLNELEAPGVLNDGRRTTYGMGLILGNYRGLPIVEHNGSLFGYRADILRFPQQRFTVVCLCNVSNANPELRSRQVADLYLRREMQPDSAVESAAAGNLPDPKVFAGQYLDPRTHILDSFTAANGTLQGWGSALRRKGANQFYDLLGDVLTFRKIGGSGGSAMQATLDRNGETYFSGERLGELHGSEADLRIFVGNYTSSEVGGEIRVRLEQGHLVLTSGDNAPVRLMAIAEDEFNAAGSLVVVFQRSSGKVTGLSAFTPAARGVEFQRTR